MRNILITGGTGFIGGALVRMLHRKNYHVIILSRKKNEHDKPDLLTSYAEWDTKKGTIDCDAVCKADGILHLAGAGVIDKKWTAEYKREILESRTKSIGLVLSCLRNRPHNVKVLVSASATGWYGEDKKNGHSFTEEEPAGNDFLAGVCAQWEAATDAAELLGIRVCRLRTGIVLGKGGGAYPEFRMPVNFRVGAVLGSGTQAVSWIHLEDLCRMYVFALENEKLQGSYNAVAPAPVSNEALIRAIGRAAKGNAFATMHVPAFLLKLMLGDRSTELLKSTTVSAEKILAAGFTFRYRGIAEAAKAIEDSVKGQIS